MDRKVLQKSLTTLGLILALNSAQAGTWSTPTKITDIGSWGPWFGVVIGDTLAAVGCAGNSIKAIDISTFTPTNRAQLALLSAAYFTKKSVTLCYEICSTRTSVITNVHVVGD